MPFHLIIRKYQKGLFEIISDEEWKTLSEEDICTNIESEDQAYLIRTKHQLEKGIYITGDIRLQSPLLKIARVTSVTSSGNTKYSISPDPYATDSGDEYNPSNDESSSSEGSFCNSKVNAIKRTLNFDNICSESVSVSTYENVPSHKSDVSATPSSTPSAASSSSLDSCQLTIYKNEVTLDIHGSIHIGTFSVPLFEYPRVNSNESVFKALLPIQGKEINHKCVFIDPRKPVGYVIRPYEETCATDDDPVITVTFQCCVRKGTAIGTFLDIKETKTWNAVLKYWDPFIDEPENTPTKDPDIKEIKMKQHYCLFCKKLKTCIGRHYKMKHSKEPRVKEIIEAAQNLETRSKSYHLMKKLRLEGDRIYNDSVSMYDRIPVRKHRVELLSRSVHCRTCSGLIAGKNFTKHDIFCSKRKADGQRRLRRLRTEERLKFSTSTENDQLFLSVVGPMKDDDCRKVIENDPLAKDLAVYLVKSQPKTHNLNNVRQQLRRTAKLFLEVQKQLPGVYEIKDMLEPTRYATMMQCLRAICAFGQSEEKRKSQLALAYGPLISALIHRLQMDLLRNNVPKNDTRMQSLDTLKLIHEHEFKIEITRQALVSSKHKQMSKDSRLPSAADIQKLMNHTRKIGDELYNKLKENFDIEYWIDLGRSLLCQLLVFNRRRIGEMSRIKVDDFKKLKQVSSDYYQTLNRLEIILADEYSIFSIMAKRNRLVNILITKSQIKQLQLLVSLRQQAGISDNNVYLFATPTQKDGYLRAGDVLRKFANECGASDPSLLKSTLLRKHVATMSQLFCLNDNEMKQLADYLGHDRNVHENFYRLNENNTQITRLSKFLRAVGDKDVFRHRGKTIEELPFDGMEDVSILQQSGDDTTDDEDEVIEKSKPTSCVSPMPCTSSAPEGIQQTAIEKSKPTSCVSPVPSASSTPKRIQQTVSKSYKLRRRSALKIPAKLQISTSTPTKKSPLKKAEHRSPFTTNQLLNMLSVSKRNRPKKCRWTALETDIMEIEFAHSLKNNCLPSLSYCEQVKQRYSNELGRRDIHSIYCWVRNTINRRKLRH